MVLGETLYCLAIAVQTDGCGWEDIVAREVLKKTGNGAGGNNFRPAKRFLFVAKEFRYHANANQKLCIALETNDRAPLHREDWRRMREGLP
jgi:hypothetical protein